MTFTAEFTGSWELFGLCNFGRCNIEALVKISLIPGKAPQATIYSQHSLWHHQI